MALLLKSETADNISLDDSKLCLTQLQTRAVQQSHLPPVHQPKASDKFTNILPQLKHTAGQMYLLIEVPRSSHGNLADLRIKNVNTEERHF